MEKLVVFDLNDTLLDSRKTYNRILINLLSEEYNINKKNIRLIYLTSQQEALKDEKR